MLEGKSINLFLYLFINIPWVSVLKDYLLAKRWYYISKYFNDNTENLNNINHNSVRKFNFQVVFRFQTPAKIGDFRRRRCCRWLSGWRRLQFSFNRLLSSIVVETTRRSAEKRPQNVVSFIAKKLPNIDDSRKNSGKEKWSDHFRPQTRKTKYRRKMAVRVEKSIQRCY